MPPPRIALFTLEALPSASAVRRFIAAHSAEIAFVGLSNAMRPSCGGLAGQVRRHLRRSGPRILPYLAVNFAIPDLVRAVDPVTARFRRSGTDAPMPLKALCRTLDIPAVRVDDVNGAEMAAAFAEHRPDLIVTFHFDQILSAETLARAPLGGLNVHPGLLPLHRGPVPTVHALAEDPPAFGVTVHRLVETIDAGPILAQAHAAMPPGCSASRAAILLHERGRLLLDDVLAAVAERGKPEGTVVEPLAYCPFPSGAFLRGLRRRKRRLTDWQDVREAIGLGRTR